jgi:hypothetical protein
VIEGGEEPEWLHGRWKMGECYNVVLGGKKPTKEEL